MDRWRMATRLVRDARAWGGGNMAEADREAEWAKMNTTEETAVTVHLRINLVIPAPPFGQSHSIIISEAPRPLHPV